MPDDSDLCLKISCSSYHFPAPFFIGGLQSSRTSGFAIALSIVILWESTVATTSIVVHAVFIVSRIRIGRIVWRKLSWGGRVRTHEGHFYVRQMTWFPQDPGCSQP